MNPSPTYPNLQKYALTKREALASVTRKAALTAAVLSLLMFGSERAPATLLYATSYFSSSSPKAVYRVDSLNQSVVLTYPTLESPDSLIFDATGKIIYTALSASQVRSYDTNNPNPLLADQLITAFSAGKSPADLTLEPNGQTILVSLSTGKEIDRINLTSHSVINQFTNFPPITDPANPEGLAYDNTGRLFACMVFTTGSYVAQLNTTTGTVVNQTTTPMNNVDGLTYDPFSQMLYATSRYGGTVYQINPNNLTVIDLQATHGWIGVPQLDGITSDGSGHLFVASPGSNAGGTGSVYDIDLINSMFTLVTFVSDGLDDLAPVVGLGAPPGEPFPGQQCCGEKPNYEDPAYASVFTGQVAIATCFAPNLTDPVLVVEDLKNQATAPLNTNYAPPSYHGPSSSWTEGNLGDIFGLTLDDSGNIYVAATTAYGNIFFPGNAMDIYRIANGTGAITLFAALPKTPGSSFGAGLGNIAYDCTHKNFYVSNNDDGLIYRLDLSGSTLSTWDHGLNLPTANPPSAAILDTPTTVFTPLGRRIWGLQAHNNRLYYAVWWEDSGRPDPVHANEVWSIALSSSGNFVPGTDQLEISMPVDVYQGGVAANYSNPVSDISFGPTGTMLLTERTMAGDDTPDAEESRALEYTLSGTTWVPATNVFSVGLPGATGSYPPLIIPGNTAGGGDYDFGAGGRVWVTGDALHLTPPNDLIYGLQGLPASGGSIVNSILIDLNGNTSESDKTQIGDVEVPCPDCEINGTVVTPSQPGAPYTYQFTVTNHSNQAASNIVILPVSGVTSITPQTIHLTPPLLPGQTSQTFTLTLNGAQPGVQACFNIALVATDGTNCCSRQLCVPIPSCFEVLSQIVTCLPNGQVQLTVTLKNLEAYTLYYAAVVPSDPTKTATPSFFTLGTPVPPFGTTTISTVISPVAFGETVFYTLTIHSSDLEICCSRDLSFTANCKRIIKGASSRLTHGGAGSFDIDMPLTGTSGVEDRDGAGNYLAVFTYDDTVTSGDATIVSGTATAGGPIFSGDEIQVPLSQVADQQNVTIELSNVNGEGGSDDMTFSFLIGDVNGDRKVNNADANLVKTSKGQPVTDSNFRDDINLNGRVDKVDKTSVSANKGHRLP